MNIEAIGVVGSGQMGSGIAHVAALAGWPVVVQDVAQAQLDRARAGIEQNLGRQVKKAAITQEQAAAALARMSFATDIGRFAETQLIVEAATENVDLKFKIFESLSRVAPAGAILASNTSSISITAIAAHTDRPDRVIGMHFMNPVPLMKLVELIRGLATSDDDLRDRRSRRREDGQDHGPRPRHARASS